MRSAFCWLPFLSETQLPRGQIFFQLLPPLSAVCQELVRIYPLEHDDVRASLIHLAE
jgi:hypothetical protein